MRARTTPLVGRKAWFGPRRFGWGLSPVSPEGWIVVATGLAIDLFLRRWRPAQRGIARLTGPAMALIAVVKGTSPGGPRARAAFDASRRAEPGSEPDPER